MGKLKDRSPSPMSDEEFMSSLWGTLVIYQEDARKLILHEFGNEGLPKETLEKMINRWEKKSGDNGFGLADLMLEAMICKDNIVQIVFTVDRARKRRCERLSYADDTPAIEYEIKCLLSKIDLCDDEERRIDMKHEANRIEGELSKRSRNVSWNDFFEAKTYEEKIKILQFLYNVALTQEEILEFIYVEDDKERGC